MKLECGFKSLSEKEFEAGSFGNPHAGSVRYECSAGILPAGSGGILPPVSSFQTSSRLRTAACKLRRFTSMHIFVRRWRHALWAGVVEGLIEWLRWRFRGGGTIRATGANILRLANFPSWLPEIKRQAGVGRIKDLPASGEIHCLHKPVFSTSCTALADRKQVQSHAK